MKQTEPKKRFMLPAEISLILGLLILTFSVIFVRISNFGIAVLTSVPFVLSQKFTFMSPGAWNTAIMVLLLVILIILTKKNIYASIFSLALAFAFGGLIDLAIMLLEGLPMDLGWRILYYLLGFLAIPLGITLFVKSGYPMLPFDSFVRDLSDYYDWKFSLTKTIFDIIFVSFSILFSIFALGGLKEVSFGTIISALFTGAIIRLYSQAIDKVIVIEPWFPKVRAFFSNAAQKTLQ